MRIIYATKLQDCPVIENDGQSQNLHENPKPLLMYVILRTYAETLLESIGEM